MRVEIEVNLDNGHSIEFGHSTWDDEKLSVRNRYPRSDGGFSPHSSSELPIEDVLPIALETLKRDFLSQEHTLEILQAALDSIKRRTVGPPNSDT